MEWRQGAMEGLVTAASHPAPRGVDSGFWRGRRVFLTGHTGFKGSWMSLWLQAMGADVTGYALPPETDPSLFELARVGAGMNSLTGDVRDPDAVRRAVEACAPEVLIHMAAQPLVRQSYREPVETYATNVMGTVHVLEAARRCQSLRAAVVVTSDKCYENRNQLWGYREDEAMGGHDPYSSSKGCAELVAAAYRSSYFAPEGRVALASGRAGNVIGGGDWAADRLVPDAIRAFESSRPVMIRNPNAVRPWQHVLEPLSGYLMLAERLHAGGPDVAEGWNFGPDADGERTVGAVIDALAGSWGDGAGWRRDCGDHPHEAGLLALDSAKARHRLGWRPRWTLDEALTAIVAWHRAHRAGADMRAVTLEQIAAHCDGRAPTSSKAEPTA